MSVFKHPQAICETKRVGPRTRIWAFAHVLPGARIGADCSRPPSLHSMVTLRHSVARLGLLPSWTRARTVGPAPAAFAGEIDTMVIEGGAVSGARPRPK